MGILNVIKLANDYNTAKKLLKDKNIQQKFNKVKQTIANLQEFIVELETMKDGLVDYIAKVKGTIRTLTARLKKGDK